MCGMVTLLCCRLLRYCVNVFQGCLNFGIVYGVGVCVNSMSVVKSVLLYVVCFLRLGVVCCDVVGVWGVVIFVLYVMHVVGSVLLWVVCEFVSVVHPVATLNAVICVICSLLMFVSDASGDHMAETYSSMGLVMALYVAYRTSWSVGMIMA